MNGNTDIVFTIAVMLFVALGIVSVVLDYMQLLNQHKMLGNQERIDKKLETIVNE